MIKKLSAFIFKDIGWKLLALFSAIVLYFIVMNVVNPPTKRQFTRNIQYIGRDVLAERGYIIMNNDKLPSTILLNIQAKQMDINNLYGQSSFTAVVDLSVIDDTYNSRLGQPFLLPININLPSVYTIMNKDPESVSIIIDKVNSVLWPVKVNITGAVKEGYVNMPAIYQDHVNVTAPESVLGEIGGINADIDIKDADKDVIVTDAALHAYDTGGNDITGSVTLSVEKIQVSVPVYPIKTVPVVARISGDPASGYWVSEKTVSPDTVDIVGPAGVLDGLNEIELAPVQLNGATEDISAPFNIADYLKDTKLSVLDDTAAQVTVNVKIDKEATKHISLQVQTNVSIIRDTSNLDVQLPADPITVTIQGPANVIGSITNSNLRGELDLSGLGEGIHDVALHLDLPSNVSVSNAPIKLRVVISSEPSTATVLPGNSEDAANPGGAGVQASDGGLSVQNATEALESEPPLNDENTDTTTAAESPSTTEDNNAP